MPLGVSATISETGPSTYLYSYHSGTTPMPTPSSDTARSTAGSNYEDRRQGRRGFQARYIFGETASGTPATYSHEFTTPATVYRVPAIPSDPLGVVRWSACGRLRARGLTNNNNRAVGGTRVGNVLTIAGNVTLVSGDYYVDRIDIANSKTLEAKADQRTGEHLSYGASDAAPHATITTTPGVPDSPAHLLQLEFLDQSSATVQPDRLHLCAACERHDQTDSEFKGSIWGKTSKSVRAARSISISIFCSTSIRGCRSRSRPGSRRAVSRAHFRSAAMIAVSAASVGPSSSAGLSPVHWICDGRRRQASTGACAWRVERQAGGLPAARRERGFPAATAFRRRRVMAILQARPTGCVRPN